MSLSGKDTKGLRDYFVYVLLAFCAIVAVPVGAATISATVVDEDTGLAIEGVDVNLYVLMDNYWSNSGYSRTDDNGDFEFSDLSAGTYYVYIYGYQWDDRDYFSEYYDDVAIWEEKTEIDLGSGDDLVLNLIELTPKPVYFKDLEVSPRNIPDSGARITLTGTVVNTESEALSPASFWVNMYTYNYEYHQWSNVTLIGPNVTSLPTGEMNFSLPIVVPAEAPIDQDFSFEIYIGHSAWEPIALGYFGGVWKNMASAFGSMDSRSGATRPRLPAKVGLDGAVLEWR